MKNFKSFLLMIIIVLVFSSWLNASDVVNFQFKNSTNQTVIVLLFWLDHDWDYPGPVNLAGGEIKPGKKFEVNNNYKPGEYAIVWKTMNSETIKITRKKCVSGLIIDELN